MKAIEWRPRAEADAADAALWFARQGGLVLGRRFLAELEVTLQRIACFQARVRPGTPTSQYNYRCRCASCGFRASNATSSIASIYRTAWTSCVCGALIVVLTH
ncbi:hypothetical protein [Stenotrophomonas maltophilia]|uniref:hypothetical protein n=1 Tax=Stenotrophomonas maltophilia TaxID=40324 RepID=UPI0034DB675D